MKRELNFELLRICACFSVVMIHISANYFFNINNSEPMAIYKYFYLNVLFPSIAIFLFFKNKISKIKFSDFVSKNILILSKCTLGIYLVHVIVYRILFQYFSFDNINNFAKIPLITLITFFISFLLVFLYKKCLHQIKNKNFNDLNCNIQKVSKK